MAIGVARDNLVSLMTRNPVELRSCVLPDASLPWIRKRTGILRVHRSCERRSRSSFVYTDIGFLRTFSFDPCLGVAWERMAARPPFTFCIISSFGSLELENGPPQQLSSACHSLKVVFRSPGVHSCS